MLQIKKDFFAMLRENTDLDRHARWSEVKKKFDCDARYKAVDSSGQREDWWREYCKILKEEKKRAKEKDREHKKDKEKHKKKDKDRDEKRERRKSDNHKDEALVDVDMESNKTSEKPDESDDKSNTDKEKDKVKGKDSKEEGDGEGDVDGDGDGEGNTSEVDEENEAAKEKEKEKERQARAEVSMREREKEVQRTLATHMRDRDKEREQHKRDEAIQHFNALLADLVRSAELGWREVKRILRKDQRWDLADTLSRDEKEKLFSDHIETIVRKKREKFRELLDETQEVSLTSTWKEIKKVIKEDPRYTKFASSERVSNNLTFTLYFYVNH